MGTAGNSDSQGGASAPGETPPGLRLARLLTQAAGPAKQYQALDDSGVVVAVGRWHANESWIASQKLAAIREIIRRRPAAGHEPEIPGGLPGLWQKDLSTEIACELAITRNAAEALIDLAWVLEVRLPLTAAALDQGILDLSKARMIATETSVLDDAGAAEAEALVAGKWAGKTWGQIRALIARAVVNIDPEGAAKRREEAEREMARVRFWREHAGTAGLAGYDLPTDRALKANARIQSRARAYRAWGISGTLDHLRVLAYLDLLLGTDARTQHPRKGSDPATGNAPDGSGRNGAWSSPGTGGRDDGTSRPPGAQRDTIPTDDHARNNKPEDDKPKDGRTRDDEQEDGRTRNSETRDCQTRDGEQEDGQIRNSETRDSGARNSKTRDNQTRDGEQEDGQTRNGEPEDGPTRDGEQEDGQTGYGVARNGEPRDGEPRDGEQENRQTRDGETRGGEPEDDQTGYGVARDDEPEDAETGDGEPGDDEPGDDEPGDGEPEGGGPDGNDGGGNGGGGGGETGGPYGGAVPDDGLPANVDLTVPLRDLTDYAQRAGEVHGLGVLDPDLGRKLVAEAARNPRSDFRVVVTDDRGRTVGFGQAIRIRKRKPGADPPPSPRHDTPGGIRDATFMPTATSGKRDTWILRIGDQRFSVRLLPIPDGKCDHRYGSRGYQPSETLRRLVQIRDGECTMPVCVRHPRGCDWEHAVPWPAGSTCACNGGMRCRHDHIIKQSPRWNVEQLPGGLHRWTTPSGLTYTKGPKEYPI